MNETPSGAGRSVLIADDSAVQRKLLERKLSSLNFQVETAVDGQRALEMARESPPDIIIADIMMPSLDGFQLCRELRSDGRLSSVPVILTSASDLDHQNHKLAVEAGASEFVLRSATFTELIEAVMRRIPAGDGAR
jgi:CheY-like chemotaxis protein